MKDEELDQDYEDEEEEESYSIRKLRKKVENAMGKLDATSEDYMILSARLTEITECEKNEKGWIIPAILQMGGSIAGTALSHWLSNRSVKRVLDYEDRGNILNTKAIPFIKKPKDF